MTPHELSVRVYYEDTDVGGVVYYANYLRFAERARTEMLRAAGFHHAQNFTETGIGFVVAKAHIEYRVPAHIDDLLTVRTEVERIGGASLDLRQDVYRGETLLAEMKITIVSVDRAGKAVKLPEGLRQIFQ